MDTIKVIGPISEEEKTILIPSLFHMERGTDCAAADAAAADDVALARSRGGKGNLADGKRFNGLRSGLRRRRSAFLSQSSSLGYLL